jgi:hypothetical protein
VRGVGARSTFIDLKAKDSTLGELFAWLPHRSIDDRPEVNDPSQQKEPKCSGKNEHDDGHQESPLQKLPEARKEEAAKSGDNIAGGPLTCHADLLKRLRRAD